MTMSPHHSKKLSQSQQRRRRRGKTKLNHRRLLMEQLEQRYLLATFNVNTTVDSVDALPGDGFALDAEGRTLTWEDSYAIALTLARLHPGIDLESVSLMMIYRWTVELPGFGDDPELANDGILEAIYQEWYEEVAGI